MAEPPQDRGAGRSEVRAAEAAFRFVLIFGVVNLFADVTYEGARSISGPFLESLGASAVAVGFIAGAGELAGFGLRSVFGFLTDRTGRYWTAVFVGYVINLFAVPALALAGNWPLAAVLLIAERTGRAIRKPAVEGMLSQAGRTIGHGWVFGLNEALDQTGATLGPLIAAWVLYRHGGYPHAFAAFLVSAVLCLATVAVARTFTLPREERDAAGRGPAEAGAPTLSRRFWLNVAAGALIAAGFADFSLIGFHFQRTGVVPAAMIPVLYSAAMATGALAALGFGWLLDHRLRITLPLAFGLSALAAPFAFCGGLGGAVLGMVLWGVGLGAQDSILKALLSRIVPAGRRSTAFGLFDTVYGLAWFAGSAAMGLLYGASRPAVAAFSAVLQLAALPVLMRANPD